MWETSIFVFWIVGKRRAECQQGTPATEGRSPERGIDGKGGFRVRMVPIDAIPDVGHITLQEQSKVKQAKYRKHVIKNLTHESFYWKKTIQFSDYKSTVYAN